MEGNEQKVEYLVALYDEADALREVPTANGHPVWVLFLALFLYLLAVADLGLMTTLAATFLLGSPVLMLVARDVVRARRRLELVERTIEELESQREGHDGGGEQPNLLNAVEGTDPSL